MFVCTATKLSIISRKTKRHRPKILSGSQKRPKAKAKTDRSIKKKGAFDKYFNH